MADAERPLQWACTISGREWALGVMEGHRQIHSVAAKVARLASGHWRWIILCEPDNYVGREPSRDHAMGAAERALGLCKQEDD